MLEESLNQYARLLMPMQGDQGQRDRSMQGRVAYNQVHMDQPGPLRQRSIAPGNQELLRTFVHDGRRQLVVLPEQGVLDRPSPVALASQPARRIDMQGSLLDIFASAQLLTKKAGEHLVKAIPLLAAVQW
ncbi:hypothetical protein D9M71_603410 [compost metagenome]